LIPCPGETDRLEARKLPSEALEASFPDFLGLFDGQLSPTTCTHCGGVGAAACAHIVKSSVDTPGPVWDRVLAGSRLLDSCE